MKTRPKTETLSLDKRDQKRHSKETKKLKKKIKSGEVTIKEERKNAALKLEESRGLIYIGHIPHGFYEDQMRGYFKQFGHVTNVKVCRSRKTGRSKGYGFVEFSHVEVAKIAANTMNNYLMFKKRLIAEYVPFDKRPKSIFHGKSSNPDVYSVKVRREKLNQARNKPVGKETVLNRARRRLHTLLDKLTKLKKCGIDLNFQPVDKPEELITNKPLYTHEADPYDSEIELKVPLKHKSKIRTVSKPTTEEFSKSKVKKVKTDKSILSKKEPKSKIVFKKATQKSKQQESEKLKKISKNIRLSDIGKLANVITTSKNITTKKKLKSKL